MNFLLYFYCKKSFQEKLWNRFQTNKNKVKNYNINKNPIKNLLKKTVPRK